MTDNASGYRSNLFRSAIDALNVRHIKTKPYTPRTNGKAERFIRTSLKEWAYRRAYESSAQRQALLGPWLGYYNQLRPHMALNGNTPISRLRNCEQCL